MRTSSPKGAVKANQISTPLQAREFPIKNFSNFKSFRSSQVDENKINTVRQ